MSSDMFPQGFLDLVEDVQWYIVSYTGLKQGPFMSCNEAAEHRNKMPCPSEWAFVRKDRVES